MYTYRYLILQKYVWLWTRTGTEVIVNVMKEYGAVDLQLQ
jgi:hypothetical protein